MKKNHGIIARKMNSGYKSPKGKAEKQPKKPKTKFKGKTRNA